MTEQQTASQANRSEFQGRSIEQWRMQLREANGTARLQAAATIGEIGPAAVPTLIEMLRDEDVNVRYWAAKGLGKSGQGSAPAVAALRKAMQADESGAVREIAAQSLYRLGEKKAGMKGLISALKDENPSVQLRAGDFLRNLGPEAREALPALEEAGRNTQDDYVGRIAKGAAEAIQK